MNNTEINTLLANGVQGQTIVMAQAAGKIQGALEQARRAVEQAADNRDGINWKELFTYFEAEMDRPRQGKAHKRS